MARTETAPPLGAPSHKVRPVHHLVLVEGPPAVGKSTFMRHLAAGNLPEEVAALLPPDASTWPQSSSNWIDDWMRENVPAGRQIEPCPGLIMHHDLMIPLYDGYKSYIEEYSERVANLANNLTIISLRASPKILAERLAERVCGVPEPSEPARVMRREKLTSQFWGEMHEFVTSVERIVSANRRVFWVGFQKTMSLAARNVPSFIRSNRAIGMFREALSRKYSAAQYGAAFELQGLKSKVALKCERSPAWQRLDSPSRVIEIYLSKEGLDAWYHQWHSHLRSKVLPRSNGRIITILSESDGVNGQVSWDVIAADRSKN